MQQMNSASLLQMSSKQLKNYIRAYNLSAKAAIEKDDLVRIILNTRPISNDSEIYYRNHRHEQLPISPPQGNDTGSNGASSTISQMFNDLFSGGGGGSSSSNSGSNNGQREAERQRRQQEERIRQQQRQRRMEEERIRQQRAHEQHQRRQEEERMRQQQAHEQQRQRRQEEERIRQQQQQQSTRKEDTVSVDEMILSKMDPKTLSVKTLKAILRANFVEQSHALEKSDLVSRVQWLIDERRKELSANDQAPVNDDSLCRICCDAQQNCVFLDCGHMVTCMDCGKQVNDIVDEKKESHYLMTCFGI